MSGRKLDRLSGKSSHYSSTRVCSRCRSVSFQVNNFEGHALQSLGERLQQSLSRFVLGQRHRRPWLRLHSERCWLRSEYLGACRGFKVQATTTEAGLEAHCEIELLVEPLS